VCLTVVYLWHRPSQDFENLLGFSEIEISSRTAVFAFVICSPRRFVSQGNMAPSDSALLDALHSAEYKLVVSERTKYDQKHFKGYDRWMMVWIYNSQMSVPKFWWLNAADDLEDRICAVARKNYDNAMAHEHEYGYCPQLGNVALAMPSCICGHCFDETHLLGQQNKYQTQLGAHLAKLMLDRQRGVPLLLDLKHIRWGVFHEKPFEPKPLIPTPTRLVPRIASNDPVSIYPPKGKGKGSSHKHTFNKTIPDHILGILSSSTFLVHDDRR
jgi:hypothetical protein